MYGAGALGSLVGGLLARAHDVTLVGRDPHVRRVRTAGLRIDGAIAADVSPRAVTDGRDRSADVAILTTKAYDVDAAASDLATGTYDVVVPLSNGLVEERLADALSGTPVLAGTASYGARLSEPGRVTCTGVGEVTVGALAGGPDPAADRVARAFDAAGIESVAAADMPRRRYEKLAVNAGINGPSALARVENGATVAAPIGAVARAAAREVAAVARAERVGLDGDAAVAALERVAVDTAANHSSMREDVAARRRTEVDAIYGAVVDRGVEHGVPTPTCRTLASLLRGWEVGQGLRAGESSPSTD